MKVHKQGGRLTGSVLCGSPSKETPKREWKKVTCKRCLKKNGV